MVWAAACCARALERCELQLRIDRHARRHTNPKLLVGPNSLRPCEGGTTMAFHLTQGTFSFLPPLTDDEMRMQVQYCLDNDWPINVEFTDDPHPRNTYWEMWGLPMFDVQDAAGVMMELAECRQVYGDRYIRVSGFDSSPGWESVRLSFIVNRPAEEPGFRLVRQEASGRAIQYTTHAYAADRLEGRRYG